MGVRRSAGSASSLRPLFETVPLVAPSFLQRMLLLSLSHYQIPIIVHNNPFVSRLPILFVRSDLA